MRGGRAAQRQAWEVLDVLDRAAVWPEEAVPASQTRPGQEGHQSIPGACGSWDVGQITVTPGPSLCLETRDHNTCQETGWVALMK